MAGSHRAKIAMLRQGSKSSSSSFYYSAGGGGGGKPTKTLKAAFGGPRKGSEVEKAPGMERGNGSKSPGDLRGHFAFQPWRGGLTGNWGELKLCRQPGSRSSFDRSIACGGHAGRRAGGAWGGRLD